jgi:hypothetical protein
VTIEWLGGGELGEYVAVGSWKSTGDVVAVGVGASSCTGSEDKAGSNGGTAAVLDDG